MKAKLIKKGEVYFLDEYTLSGMRTIANSLEKPDGLIHHLSIKNCQEIERGYDLDELAMEACDCEANRCIIRDEFKKGFQKALEILGDKKFSEEDLMNCWNEALTFKVHKKTFGEYTKSIQQNEWECIILLDEETNKPLLDANGCLILKRV